MRWAPCCLSFKIASNQSGETFADSIVAYRFDRGVRGSNVQALFIGFEARDAGADALRHAHIQIELEMKPALPDVALRVSRRVALFEHDERRARLGESQVEDGVAISGGDRDVLEELTRPTCERLERTYALDINLGLVELRPRCRQA